MRLANSSLVLLVLNKVKIQDGVPTLRGNLGSDDVVDQLDNESDSEEETEKVLRHEP